MAFPAAATSIHPTARVRSRRRRSRLPRRTASLRALVLVLCLALGAAGTLVRLTPTAPAGAAGATDTLLTVAGTGTAGSTGDNGPATSATLSSPYAAAYDARGNLFVADRSNNRVRRIDLQGRMKTVAGGGTNTCLSFATGCTATTVKLAYPSAVAFDAAGNLFVADSTNNRIRKVAVNTDGQIDGTESTTVVAGGSTSTCDGDAGCQAQYAKLAGPAGLAFDATGNLYVADTAQNRVRQILAGSNGAVEYTDTLKTLVGDSGGTTTSPYGDGGAASAGGLDRPYGLAFDPAGNLYVADSSHNKVRRVAVGTNGIERSDTVSTVVGTGSTGSSPYGDGSPASAAQLYGPFGVTVDGAGNLYVSDRSHNRVRKVAADNGAIEADQDRISTVTGGGTSTACDTGCAATDAQLSSPRGVVADPYGYLVTVDSAYNRVRRQQLSTATQFAVAGTGTAGSSGDNGPAASAQLNAPAQVAARADGGYYVAEPSGNRLRSVNAAGTITTLAGTGAAGYGGDGGTAASALLKTPSGVAVSPVDASVYVADTDNSLVRRIDSQGNITRVAGYVSGGTPQCGFGGDGGAATSAKLNRPTGLAFATDGSLYVADFQNSRIRKVTPDTDGLVNATSGDRIATFAGNGTAGYAGDGATATAAKLSTPNGVAAAPDGSVSIADTGNCLVRRVASGTINRVAGYLSGGVPQCGYAGDGGDALSAKLNYPRSVAADRVGNLYVGDTSNYRVRKVGANSDRVVDGDTGSSGDLVSTVAGTGTTGGYAGGNSAANSANLASPGWVGLDAFGNVLVSDATANRVLRLVWGTPIAPQVAAAADKTNAKAPLTVAFSAPQTGDSYAAPVAYTWDFGDGTSGSGASVAHTYTSQGAYTARLALVDAAELSATASTQVTVNAPNAAPSVSVAATYSPDTRMVPNAVTFTPTVTEDDATLASWQWTVGGDCTDQTGALSGLVSTPGPVTCTYTTEGTHTVALAVNDNDAASASATGTAEVIANHPPAAAFGATKDLGSRKVAFDASASTDPDGDAVAEYRWDFGDGSTDTTAGTTDRTVAHEYAADSTGDGYTVGLTVVDARGLASAQTIHDVDVSLPVVTLASDTALAQTPAAVTLTADLADVTAAASGAGTTISSVAFDFDDAQSATVDNPTATTVDAAHTYRLPGSYEPTVTVTTAGGATFEGTLDGAITTYDTISAAATAVSSGGGATDMAAAVKFLYDGADAVQKRADGTAISPPDADRVAVVRGTVLKKADGGAFAGVAVSVPERPEWGETATRSDGAWDLAVEGGKPVTVRFDADGYFPVERLVKPRWRDYGAAPDVHMMAIPDYSSSPTLNLAGNAGSMQVVSGPVTSSASDPTDGAGTRQMKLFFQPTTTAAVGGIPVSSGRVAITEFTTGDTGQTAMPGPLPPTSGYTYAAELSVQGLESAQVDFADGDSNDATAPVIAYTTNFLNVEAGKTVPSGYYDRAKHAWVPTKDGLVVKIVSEANGKANLDVTGDGLSNTADTTHYATLGITDAERAALASQYEQGDSLWRVPLTHFSAEDCNFSTQGPESGDGQTENPPDTNDDSCQNGSVIYCQVQVLGEDVPLADTPGDLHYRSDRVPGNKALYTATVRVTDDTVSGNLYGAKATAEIAGRVYVETITDADPNNLKDRTISFAWDGRDAYGRRLQGAQPVTVLVEYVYTTQPYYQAVRGGAGFATSNGNPLPTQSGGQAARGGQKYLTYGTTLHDTIGGYDARASGLGGLDVDGHDFYDSRTQTLYKGDGSKKRVPPALNTVAYQDETLVPAEDDDGESSPTAVTTDSEGNVYVLDSGIDGSLSADAGGCRQDVNASRSCIQIVKVSPSGNRTVVVDSRSNTAFYDSPYDLDETINDLELGPDGAFYAVASDRVARISPGDGDGWDGGDRDSYALAVVAGGGASTAADGITATSADLGATRGVGLAADGSLYVSDAGLYKVFRVGTDGVLTTAAGTGVPGGSGVPSGTAATTTPVNAPRGVAVGPAGDVYFADPGNHVVQRIGTDGKLYRVAGDFGSLNAAPCAAQVDGVPATAVLMEEPYDVALDEDGAVYVTDHWDFRVRKVDAEGIVTTVAGTGWAAADPGFHDDSTDWGSGGVGTAVTLGAVEHVAVTPGGDVYSTQDGDDTWYTPSCNSDTGLGLYQPDRLWKAERILPAREGDEGTGQATGSSFCGQAPDEAQLVADGAELEVFDLDGRHLCTLNAATGTELASFEYDDVTGKLAAIHDTVDLYGDGSLQTRTTEVHADGDGTSVQVVGPFGHVTLITLNGDGWATQVCNLPDDVRYAAGVTPKCDPANADTEAVALAYEDEGGLLAGMVDPAGTATTDRSDDYVHAFAYDAATGKLASDTNPDGGTKTLAATSEDFGDCTTGTGESVAVAYSRTVSLTDSESRAWRYDMQVSCDETETYAETDPAGSATVRKIDRTDGWVTTETAPDGTVTTETRGPDPRWGLQEPVAEETKVTLPATDGQTATTRTTAESDAVTLTDLCPEKLDPACLATETVAETATGRTTTTTYTKVASADDTVATVYPPPTTGAAQPKTTAWIDDLGRPRRTSLDNTATAAVPEQADTTYGYMDGNLTGVGRGDRQTTLEYGDDNRLASVTDAAGHVTAVDAYDTAGRPTEVTRSDMSVPTWVTTTLAYDRNGNATSVKTPHAKDTSGDQAHAYTYTENGLASTYETPKGELTTYGYDSAERLTTLANPDGSGLAATYAATGGRLDTLTLTGGNAARQDLFGYGYTGSQLTSVDRDAATLSYTWQGALPESTTWGGALTGSVAETRNGDFLRSSLSVSGASAACTGYDADLDLASVDVPNSGGACTDTSFLGSLAVTRDAATGLPTATSVGAAADTTTYNAYGQPADYSATANSAAVYSLSVSAYDGLGRIASQTENATATSYGYDGFGRLHTVSASGGSRTYAYDANGNPAQCSPVAGQSELPTAEYENPDEDQLTACEDATGARIEFAYTANGQLYTRTVKDAAGNVTTTTRFVYDAAGELASAAVTGSTTKTVAYGYDGQGRRVTRSDGTTTTKYLYDGQDRVVAELDADDNVTSSFVFTDESNGPVLLQQGSTLYRVLTDPRGSVRRVVDTATGAVVQSTDYDEWGNVTASTSTGGFRQPLGFAAGLTDADTGLVHFGARDYDPATGRWTTRDPVGLAGGTNVYAYAGGDPVNFVDPSGLVGECYWCGRPLEPGQKSRKGQRPPDNERQRDHWWPKSDGGSDECWNKEDTCRKCNRKKSNRQPQEKWAGDKNQPEPEVVKGKVTARQVAIVVLAVAVVALGAYLVVQTGGAAGPILIGLGLPVGL